MKTIMKILVALALLAGIVFTGVQVVQAAGIAMKPALILTHQQLCLSDGGIWSGGSSLNGICTYPPGSTGHSSIGQCSGNQDTLVSFYGYTSLTGQKDLHFSRSVPRPSLGGDFLTYCEGISSDGPGYGKCGNEAGKTDDAVTVNTCHGISVTFDAGACTGKCTVGPKVLNTAKKGLSQLDGEVLGETYVKLRNPSGGSYKICMPGEGTIYKWVSGAWVAQPTSTVNGVSCAWSSGDGNYVLVTP